MRSRRIGMATFCALLALALTGFHPARSLFISPFLAQAQTVADRKAEANRLLQQGIEQYQHSQFEAALQSWQQALLIYQAIHDRQGEGAALGNLGNAYESLGQYEQAITYYQQHLAIARDIKDRLGEGHALGNLGNAYLSLGQYEPAIQYHQQALAIDREIKNRLGEGQGLGNLGNAYLSLGQYEQAITYYQQALAIARDIKDRLGEGHALGNLGNAYFDLGQYEQAITYYQQHLAIARDIKDRQGEGAALGNLGLAYADLGQYEQAITYYQQHLAIARDIKDRQGEGAALGNLGNAYESLGQYEPAIQYHQQALAIDREIKNRLGEGQDLGNLGLAYADLSQYEQAITYYQQHLAIARDIKDRQGEGAALGNLGNAYAALDQYEQAIQYYQQHLAIAQEIKDRLGESHALGNLGLAYAALGQYEQAIQYHQQDLAIARDIKDRLGEGQALNNLGWVLYRAGKLAAAAQTLRQAIAVQETLHHGLKETDQITLLDSQQTSYLNLQQVEVALKQPQAALAIAERGRAQSFAQRLCQRYSATPMTAACTVPPITISQIQQVARQQNATLVEYSLITNSNPPQLYIWVVPPVGPITFRATPLTLVDTAFANVAMRPRQAGPDRGEVVIASAERIRGALDAIGATGRNAKSAHPDPVQERQYLQVLYQQLIQPIASLLPKAADSPVIFMPQGPFFQVPFAALQDAKGTPLIDRYTILSAPSIQSLALILHQPRQGTATVQDALIVGNPAVTSVTLVPGQPPEPLLSLPGAATEAQQIAAFYHTQPLLGAAASKAAVLQRLPQANLIHLATHGFLDDVKREGIPGALALTPDRNAKDDGLLTANELIPLRLKAELVVLSACDSGGGRITGDGVVGLSRAFMAAGAPDVLVSLWKVPDAPTAMLMQTFYQQWRAHPEKGKAWALRAAMRATKQQYREPLAWAAFTLIGVAK